ncbi:MAG: hypothetical protein OEM97_12045 [Acidimicrobiia bacterium]|nr:hypothetical protein [Acidimicrobiia bacterium]
MTWIVMLMGFPGSGKLTVARALQARLERSGHSIGLVANHSIDNIVLRVVNVGGQNPVPEGTSERIADVRAAVFQTVQDLAAPTSSFIFTNHLTDSVVDIDVISRLMAIAEKRESAFVPVRLLCELTEIERRIRSAERRALMKECSAEAVIRSVEAGEMVLATGHENELTLDVTNIPAADAAAAVERHMEALFRRA